MSEWGSVENPRTTDLDRQSYWGSQQRYTLKVFGGFFGSDGVTYWVVCFPSGWVRDCRPPVPREGGHGVDDPGEARVVVPARQAGNRFLGSLKDLKIRALVKIFDYFLFCKFFFPDLFKMLYYCISPHARQVYIFLHLKISLCRNNFSNYKYLSYVFQGLRKQEAVFSRKLFRKIFITCSGRRVEKKPASLYRLLVRGIWISKIRDYCNMSQYCSTVSFEISRYNKSSWFIKAS
jgi:hypothetical protein